jgi:DNA-binding beta-propeller fold protein YncE
MNRLPSWTRSCALYALSALVAGCGGTASQPALPTVATGSSPSQARAAHGALLYVSDTATSEVYVFSYPKGKLLDSFTGFQDPAGECVDASGNVFITNTGGSNIIEYGHGGSAPIATLKDAGWFPIGCSVDPVSGNLAVSNFSSSGSGPGDVVIYKHAKGRPTGHYTNAKMINMLLCGYDATGNLFLDGLGQGSAFVLAELPHGGASLENISVDRSIGNAGGVMWDGKYVAVGDQSTNLIYQFNVKGKKATTAGSTTLGGASEVFQFWIDGSKVIGADAVGGDAGIWSYPTGGAPVKTIGGLYAPLGVVVSAGN